MKSISGSPVYTVNSFFVNLFVLAFNMLAV